jgi:hypothetical protein
MVDGSWRIARSEANSSWLMAHGSWLIANSSWLIANSSWVKKIIKIIG